MCIDDFPIESDDWLKARNHKCYIMKGFPQAIQGITAGTSLIKSTFDIGEAGDENAILVDRPEERTADTWNI